MNNKNLLGTKVTYKGHNALVTGTNAQMFKGVTSVTVEIDGTDLVVENVALDQIAARD